MLKTTKRLAGVSMIALMASLSFAEAQAIRSGFDSNTLAPNDDGSTGLVDIGFNIDFFGVETTQLYVNNNGNVTLDAALGSFTPFDLTSTSQQIIAPFFADVDTSNAGSPVTYGQGTVDGNAAFGVNWVDVDYFASSLLHTNRNSFQLVLIDQGGGDFIIEFNYDQIQWEAGQASGGDPNGLGGNSARAGFSNGTGDPGTFSELDGSAVNGAFLDSGPAGTALILNSLNSEVLGRYVFFAVGGTIILVPTSGNDGGIMATEGAIMLTRAQTEDLRQLVRANNKARDMADAGSTAMSMNGLSTAKFSVWAKMSGGKIDAEFGEELDQWYYLGQAGVEAAVSDAIAVGVSLGGGVTETETSTDKLEGEALFVEPYIAYTNGPLTAVASFVYTRTNYDDSTDLIDDSDRYAGSLSVGYDMPFDDRTMLTPFGYIAGGIERLDTSDGKEDLDFIIGRAGLEVSRNTELLNTGAMNVFGSLAAEYVSGDEPNLGPALLLTDYDDDRLGARVEAGFDFTLAGTSTQIFAAVHGTGIFSDSTGFGGRFGLKVPF
jgi:hypothetical protein